MTTSASHPALALVDGDRAVLLGAEAEADPLDHLLHALAGSLTTVLAYLTTRAQATTHDPEHDLSEAVVRERKRLGLTKREAEVLTLVARGFTNREIAGEFVISARTAEHHVAHILRKLGAVNRREAGAIARRLASPPVPPLTLARPDVG